MNTNNSTQIYNFLTRKGFSTQTTIKWIAIIEDSILQASENNPVNQSDIEILEADNHLAIFVNGTFGKVKAFDSKNILK